MTLEQLGKEIQEFIKESLETVVELKKTQDELMKKVEERHARVCRSKD